MESVVYAQSVTAVTRKGDDSVTEKDEDYKPDEEQETNGSPHVEITVPDSVIYDGKTIPYEEYLRMVEDGDRERRSK